MGTNYYARIIPSESSKKVLIDLIVENNFKEIKYKINELYGSVEVTLDGNLIGGEVHLGKRSSGWKFLWNPNIYIVHNGHVEWTDYGNGIKHGNFKNDPDTYINVYPLTKEGIREFISRDDIEIYDEYDEKQDKFKFFNMALTWNQEDGWDSDSYNKYEISRNPTYRLYKCSGEYIDMLESKGYKLSKTKSDFYSDSLRFATTTEFS